MPKGFMLIRFDGPWKAARAVLCQAQFDPRFAERSGAVIEDWAAAMGSADFCAIIYGPTLETLRRAAVEIRERLTQAVPLSTTLTTTVSSSTLREQEDAGAEAMAVIRSRLEACSKGTPERTVRMHETLSLLLAERLGHTALLLEAWEKQKPIPLAEQRLLAALQQYLRENGASSVLPLDKIATRAIKAGAQA